jgi:hypothetical protein
LAAAPQGTAVVFHDKEACIIDSAANDLGLLFGRIGYFRCSPHLFFLVGTSELFLLLKKRNSSVMTVKTGAMDYRKQRKCIARSSVEEFSPALRPGTGYLDLVDAPPSLQDASKPQKWLVPRF